MMIDMENCSHKSHFHNNLSFSRKNHLSNLLHMNIDRLFRCMFLHSNRLLVYIDDYQCHIQNHRNLSNNCKNNFHFDFHKFHCFDKVLVDHTDSKIYYNFDPLFYSNKVERPMMPMVLLRLLLKMMRLMLLLLLLMVVVVVVMLDLNNQMKNIESLFVVLLLQKFVDKRNF